jgi:hypothetical protein
VTVYSGLNGTGTVLATIPLSLTPDGIATGGAGCSGNYDYCPWAPIGVTFAGTAESVLFSGSANYIGFDDVTLGSATPTPGTPEPGAFSLLGLGLASLGLIARRKKA